MLARLIMSTACLLSLSLTATAATWKVDESHSSATFKIRHLMVSNVTGTVKGVQGSLEINDADITKSKVTATLDASTINTGDTKRDEHLRSPDFLNVAKFPQIKFESKTVAKDGDKLKVTGALTLNGVTKDVVLDVEGPTPAIKSPFGDQRRGVSAQTKINRKDFGVVWNKALDGGGVVVGEELAIQIDLEVTDKINASH